MSAFVHSPNHIAAILVSAHPLGLEQLTVDGVTYEFFNYQHLETLAEVLMGENVRSYNYRYAASMVRDGEQPEVAELVQLFPSVGKPRLLTLPQLLMALISLDYQSCETDDYERREASILLNKMISWVAAKMVGAAYPAAREMACKLPEYDKAGTWSID